VLLLAPLLLTGCGDPPPGQMKQGDELYTYYCQNCHQQSGLGPFLERLPPTEPPLQRHEIVLMIEQRKTHMPTFSQLSDQQADALAAFVIERRRAQASAPANPN
jgi:mono/diheme cytochrome c family protein